MDITTLLILTALVVLLLYTIVVYNQLVHIRNNVKKSWANIDVLLKQRHDELPKLVDTCKKYMEYERETLDRITQAREAVMNANDKGDISALGGAETQLRIGLGQLFARAEQYPDLKTNQTFLHLQQRISALEDNIADRRELYNSSVNINNIRIAQFPDMIVAGIFKFKKQVLLKFADEELKDHNISTLFH